MLDLKQVIEDSFSLYDKCDELVPFILNDVQSRYLGVRSTRDIIMKFRQYGLSSLLVVIGLIECLTKQKQVVVMRVPDSDGIQWLWGKIDTYFTHSLMKSDWTYVSRNCIEFHDTQSELHIYRYIKNIIKVTTFTGLYGFDCDKWTDTEIIDFGNLQPAISVNGSMCIEGIYKPELLEKIQATGLYQGHNIFHGDEIVMR